MDEAELKLLITAQIAQAEAAVKEVGRSVDGMARDFEESGATSSAALDGVKASIDGVRNDLMRIHDKSIKIAADTAKAEADLKAFEAMVAAIPDHKNVKIDVARRTIDYGGSTPTGGGPGGRGGMGILGKSLIASSPLASPLFAGAAAGVMGLASAFTSATAGAAGFGAVATGVLSNVFKQSHNLTMAQQAYNRAVTSKQKQAALMKEKQAWDALDASQQKDMRALRSFESFWKSFTKQFEKPVTAMFMNGLKTVENLLKDMAPVITAAGQAFSTLEKEASKALQSPFWKQFFSFLGGTAKPDIEAFGNIIGNVGKGFAGLMEAFNPMSQSMIGGLVSLTKGFADWATSLQNTDGFKKFIQYVDTNGPKILNTIGNLAHTVGNLLVAMAPIGTVILSGIQKLSKWMAELTKHFIEWENHIQGTKAFQNFIRFVQTNGPKMVQIMKNLGKIIKTVLIDIAPVAKNILKNLEPLASTVLSIGKAFTKWAADLIKAHPHMVKLAAEIGAAYLGFRVFLRIVRLILSPFKKMIDMIVGIPKKVKGAIDGIKKFTGGIKKATQQVKTAAKKVGEFASKMMDAAKKGAKAGKELIVRFAKNIEKLAKDAANAGKEIAKKFTSVVVNVGKKSVASAKDITTKFIKAIQDLASEAAKAGKKLAKQFTSMIVDLTKKAKDAAKAISTKLIGAIKNTAIQAGKTAGKIAELTGKIVIQSSKWLIMKARILAVRGAQLLATAAQWLFNAAMDANPIGIVILAVAGLAAGIYELVKHFKSIKKWAEHAWNAIKHIGTVIGNVFGGLWNKAYNWGRHMLDGFVSGIKSMFGAIGNAASGAIHAAERFLGFHSPAKEGPGQHIIEWGQNMIIGFTDGIMNQLPHLRSALSTALVNPLSENALQVGHHIESNAIGSLHGGGSVTHVHNNITVQGSVIREQELTNMVTTGLWDQMKGQGKF